MMSSPITQVDVTVSGRYQPELLLQWDEEMVQRWLIDVGMGAHQSSFAEHNIIGESLVLLDHACLKRMQIDTLGERMRILILVKKIHDMQQRLVAANLSSSMTSYATPEAADSKKSVSHSNMYPLSIRTSPAALQKISQSASKQKSAPQSPVVTTVSERPSPISAKFGRPSNFAMDYQDAPTQHSAENYEKLAQKRVVRVIGDDGQRRIVDVTDVTDESSFYARILGKFSVFRDKDVSAVGVLEAEMQNWVIVVIENGTDRPLRADEVTDIGIRIQ
jgi:mitogen-activated protein kinase kinase kinase